MAYNPLGGRPGGPGYDPNQQNRPLGSRPGMVGSDSNSPWNFGASISNAMATMKDKFGFGTETEVPETKTFDPSDKDQVGQMQSFLNEQGFTDAEGNKLETDSMFGPKTEHAYRNYVNKTRTDQGLDPYTWDAPDQAAQVNQGPTGVLNPDYSPTGNLLPSSPTWGAPGNQPMIPAAKNWSPDAEVLNYHPSNEPSYFDMIKDKMQFWK